MSAGTPRHRARSDVAPAADRVWPCGSCIDRRGAPAVLRVEACAEVEEAVDCVRGAGEGEDGAAVRRHHGQAFAIEELVDARVIAEHQRFDHADARTAGELFEERVIPSVVEGPGGEGGAPSAHPGPSTTLGMTRHPLPEMSPLEETLSDYQSAEVTVGPHLLEHFRAQLKRDNVLSAADLKFVPNGSRVTTAGAVIVRQRPGTAKGFVFLTLEDETGLSQAIVNPQLFAEWRSTILGHSGLIVEGIVQNGEGQASVRAERFWPLEGLHDVQSHDFH